jgi:hypothetical protein
MPLTRRHGTDDAAWVFALTPRYDNCDGRAVAVVTHKESGMGFFSKILAKLGIGSTAAAQADRRHQCRCATREAGGGEPAKVELAA